MSVYFWLLSIHPQSYLDGFFGQQPLAAVYVEGSGDDGEALYGCIVTIGIQPANLVGGNQPGVARDIGDVKDRILTWGGSWAQPGMGKNFRMSDSPLCPYGVGEACVLIHLGRVRECGIDSIILLNR